MAQAARIVFSNIRFTALAGVIFALMATGLLILSEYIFLEPYIVGHLPSGGELGFALILILSALSALVIPMNIFRITTLNSSKKKISGGAFGSVIGAAAGACSCGPVGFAVISTFGSVGATATAFLTIYETPIRIAAILVLAVTYVTTTKSLRTECKLA